MEDANTVWGETKQFWGFKCNKPKLYLISVWLDVSNVYLEPTSDSEEES